MSGLYAKNFWRWRFLIAFRKFSIEKGGQTLNNAIHLEWSAFFFPDRPVISEGDAVTGYARLNRQANRVATALINLKVQPGDHIGIFAPNSGDWKF